MKSLWLNFILLPALFGGASVWAEIITNTPAKFPSIVTLRHEADQDGCAKDFAISQYLFTRKDSLARSPLNYFFLQICSASVII